MSNRRTFIRQVAAAGIASSIPSILSAQEKNSSGRKMIWANLLHLSFNMWEDSNPEK